MNVWLLPVALHDVCLLILLHLLLFLHLAALSLYFITCQFIGFITFCQRTALALTLA